MNFAHGGVIKNERRMVGFRLVKGKNADCVDEFYVIMLNVKFVFTHEFLLVCVFGAIFMKCPHVSSFH